MVRKGKGRLNYVCMAPYAGDGGFADSAEISS